jgi:hypothetical protein
VARPLENKVSFFRLLDEMSLPHPRWEEVDLARVGYDEVARRLGSRLIVQGAHGFSGNRTFAVNDAQSYAVVAERLRQRRARVAETVAGLPVTLNACVDDERVVVGRLFHQVTGVPECTVYPLGACGNDWAAAPLSETVQAQAAGIARAIGSTIRERGFRGIYGMDFMVTPHDKVVSIEINPRLISSVPMYTRLQRARGEEPLLVRHLMATAGARCSADGAPPARLIGSQMVLHNLHDGGARVHGDVAAGIHVLRDGALKFVRPSFRVDDCAEKDEFLVLPPAPGHALSAAGECARVQMRRAALEFPQRHDMGVLNGEARAIAQAVYAALDLRPAEGGDHDDED